MNITGTHMNCGAQAWASAEFRAGKLEDRDYTIEEIEKLYAHSFESEEAPRTSPPPEDTIRRPRE